MLDMKKQKHIGLRIDEEIWAKFYCVAKYEDRSGNGQLMYLINKSIREYEAEHGKIVLEKAADEEK